MLYNPKRQEVDRKISEFKLEVIRSANRIGITPLQYTVALLDLVLRENSKKLPRTMIPEKD